MGKIYKLNEDTNIIMKKIKSNQNLLKLVSLTSYDPTIEADITSPNSLINKNIMPIPFAGDIVDITTTYLMFHFSNITSNGGSFENVNLTFTILCHKDLWLIKSGIRPYAIANELEEIFNDKQCIGIGTMYLSNMSPVYANDSYKGYNMTFRIVDFVTK